jgi:hypothetical protein
MNSRNEEVGLNVSKYMEDIPTVTQISMSIVQDAFGQDSLLADEGNPDSGTEAAVRHIPCPPAG